METSPTVTSTLSLHDALPISRHVCREFGSQFLGGGSARVGNLVPRSEEHTSELQSHHDLVCRLLLEKKNKRSSSSAHHWLTACWVRDTGTQALRWRLGAA